jgi:hypothetical protein
MQALGRAGAAALLGALAGAAWLSLFYGAQPTLFMEFDTTPPRLMSGVYPAEREPESGLTFAWTAEEMAVRLPGVSRQVEWVIDLRLRSGRSAPGTNPDLAFYADGVLLLTRSSPVDFEDLHVVVPARPERHGLTVSMRVSSTFVPGPSDPRPLGVMLDRMTLSPEGTVLPPRASFVGTICAASAMGAALALLGTTAGTAVGAIVLLSAGIAAMMSRGFGPYTAYAETVAHLALWIGGVMVLCTAAVQLLRGMRFRNTARFVVAFSASALLLRLMLLLHPNMPVGDAMFHAHRFQDVLAGKLYFTSLAPGNYAFPYAPGLYVFAMPLAGLVRRGAADMALLRVVVTSAAVLAAMLLYGIVARARGDRRAGAIAVALCLITPLDLSITTVGNLTNAFAESIAVGALALVTSPSLRAERRLVVMVFAIVLTCAFLSHTSTFAILSVSAMIVAVLFRVRGGPALRSPSNAALIALAAAVVIAIGLYYAHFADTYRSELTRIATGTASADAGGRGTGARLVSIPRFLWICFGTPLLALGAWGGLLLWRLGPRDRFTLSVAGWSVACLLFLLLGILTPVEMRYYLAAIPVVAMTAGVAASRAWSAGGVQQLAAGMFLTWAVINSITLWWTTLVW